MSDIYLKPQSPMEFNGKHFYPITTADQVVLDGNKRLNEITEGIVYKGDGENVEEGKLVYLYDDEKFSIIIYPKTKTRAITDDNGNALNEILQNFDSSLYQINETIEGIDNSLKETNNELLNKQDKHKTFQIFFPVNQLKYTALHDSVTATNTIFVAPDPRYFKEYCEAGLYCSKQENGKLVFECSYAPSIDILINIFILD